MAVTLSGEGQYIEALSPVVNDFSGGTGLRVRLKNSSSCRSLTLYYTTISSSEYSDSRRPYLQNTGRERSRFRHLPDPRRIHRAVQDSL